MGKSVIVALVGAGGLGQWTPETDVTLEGAYVDSPAGAVDLAISTDPSADVNLMLNPGITVFTTLIAFFQLSSVGGQRVLDAPVLAGETVYFSADGPCSIQLTYRDQLI